MPKGFIPRIDRLERAIGTRLRGPDWYRREIEVGVCPGFVLDTLYRIRGGRNPARSTYEKLGRVFNKPPSFFFDLAVCAEKAEKKTRLVRLFDGDIEGQFRRAVRAKTRAEGKKP